ncbi:MAG TPA: hypothetical protein VKC53_03820 [Patescibacteria group bacterium]|nr:hypothetical protein [Patescibacteria group bacterium]
MELLLFLICSRFFWVSLFQELVFWNWKTQIFNWNPQNREMDKVTLTSNRVNLNKKDGKEQDVHEWRDIKDVYSEAPLVWKIYRFILELVGIFVGWNLIYFAVMRFIQLQYEQDIGNLWNLLLALILGLIGIAGRIPVIVDSVQDWFKR